MENLVPVWLRGCLFTSARFVLKTPFYGAQTTLYCVLDDSIECESGEYYKDCAKSVPSIQAQDKEAAKKLWELSEKMVSQRD